MSGRDAKGSAPSGPIAACAADPARGEGSRKRVYLAYDTQLDRKVAIAVIKTDGLAGCRTFSKNALLT